MYNNKNESREDAMNISCLHTLFTYGTSKSRLHNKQILNSLKSKLVFMLNMGYIFILH